MASVLSSTIGVTSVRLTSSKAAVSPAGPAPIIRALRSLIQGLEALASENQSECVNTNAVVSLHFIIGAHAKYPARLQYWWRLSLLPPEVAPGTSCELDSASQFD